MDQERFEARKKYHANLRVNLKSGKYAVAIVGRQEWMRRSAIGDGITSATAALVTRCETMADAERIAVELNDLEPGVLPGDKGAWIFEALPYRKTDYIGQQNIDRSQTRDVDRRIASL